MIRLSILLLLLTIPLLEGSPLLGVPLWVWSSLGATVLYALALIFAIETRWERLKEPEDG